MPRWKSTQSGQGIAAAAASATSMVQARQTWRPGLARRSGASQWYWRHTAESELPHSAEVRSMRAIAPRDQNNLEKTRSAPRCLVSGHPVESGTAAERGPLPAGGCREHRRADTADNRFGRRHRRPQLSSHWGTWPSSAGYKWRSSVHSHGNERKAGRSPPSLWLTAEDWNRREAVTQVCLRTSLPRISSLDLRLWRH